MFLTIKPYLHLNCVLMLNWIISNRTVFDIEIVFTLNWIVTYNCLTSLKWKCFWQLNSVLMLNWIVLNRTDYLHKMDLALNNLQRLICHKTQPTNQNYIKIPLVIYLTLFIDLFLFKSQSLRKMFDINDIVWLNYILIT